MSNEISNDDIKDFVKLVLDSGVAEMEVQRGENRVRIRRVPDAKDILIPQMSYPYPVQHMQPVTVPAVDQNSTAASVPAAAIEQQPAAQTTTAGSAAADIIVKSPIVGTYYDSPKPGDPPFVRVGDVVEPGQVLCIIESMKLMNEIESEVAGTVTAKLMENGRPVEYGEALFTIRPR